MKQTYTKLPYETQLQVLRSAYYGHTYMEMAKKYHIWQSTISFLLSRDNLLETIRGMEWEVEDKVSEIQTQKEWIRFLTTLCVALTVLSVALYFGL